MGFRGALLKPSEKGERRPTASRTIAKASRYEVLKEKVRVWCEDRFKIGEALAEIQRDKLYKNEYATFEELCETEFDIKRAQAYRLIEAVSVKTSLSDLSPMGDKIVSHVLHSESSLADTVTNERQARALGAVPEEKRVEVLIEAAKAPGPVTAKRITEAAKAPKIEKAVILDKTDFPIPDSVLEDWQRAETRARGWLSTISKLRMEIKSDLDEADVIVATVTNTTLSDLNNAYTSLKGVTPYAVCTSCQGHQRKKCNLCKGRGFLDHFSWNSFVSPEMKKLREKK